MRRLAPLVLALLLALASAPAGQQADRWFCPMHAEVTAAAPGLCSKCMMALVQGDPFDTRDFAVSVRTRPAAIRAGKPFTLQMTVTAPGSNAPVRRFEVVHDKAYHLFVISADFSSFQHIHPDRSANGDWTITVTVPTPGYYWLLSDFLPTGAAPQFLTRTLVTANYDGSLAADSARLVPDATPESTDGDLTASLALDPSPLLSGEYGHLVLSLRDARTGTAVTDLQPYLGAVGHTLIVSEDMREIVHAHPTPGAGVTRGTGGPQLTFEGYLPKPGVYRAWTQVRRRDRLHTFASTFRVEDEFRRTALAPKR